MPQVGLKMLKSKTGDSFCRKISLNMATHVLFLERKITNFLLDLISYIDRLFFATQMFSIEPARTTFQKKEMKEKWEILPRNIEEDSEK